MTAEDDICMSQYYKIAGKETSWNAVLDEAVLFMQKNILVEKTDWK